jgi:hypothetical protein
MLLMFRDTIEVINETGQRITVTPVAYCYPSGRRRPLPVLSSGSIAWPVFRYSRRLDPGARTRISFDADDCDPSDLIVRGQFGGPRRLVLAEYQSGSPFEAPEQSQWTLSDVLALQEAPDALLDVEAEQRRWVLGTTVVAFGWVPWLGLVATHLAVRAADRRRARG